MKPLRIVGSPHGPKSAQNAPAAPVAAHAPAVIVTTPEALAEIVREAVDAALAEHAARTVAYAASRPATSRPSYSTREFAERHGIPYREVLRMVRTGELGSVPTGESGRYVRIRWDHETAWLNATAAEVES